MITRVYKSRIIEPHRNIGFHIESMCFLLIVCYVPQPVPTKEGWFK
jgi:hypothetical protein